MIIDKNGIRVNVSSSGGICSFEVLSQTDDATKTLDFIGPITDLGSGYSIKTNNYPAYNRKKKRFFIRGKDKSGDNNIVQVSDVSQTQLVAILDKLLGLIKMPTITKSEHDSSRPVQYRPKETGGTTHIRWAVFGKTAARRIELTGHDFYPDEPEWPGPHATLPVKPVVTVNKHFNEHLAQAVDVLNKSVSPEAKIDLVPNPHKVTHRQAKLAVDSLRKLYKDAVDGNYVVALHRLLTGIRGFDEK